jgi:hypothetical protein
LKIDGLVKFFIDKKGAPTLIHEVLVAMKSSSGTIDNITKTFDIHPAL